jgi:hypothetical protein
MPLGFTALSTALASTSNTATYAGNAGTPAAGELLICFVIASGNTTGNLTGTFTWNLLTQFTRPASDQIYVFWAYASSATSVTPTFNSTSGNATGCIISAVRVTGAEGQTQPYLRQFKTLTNTNTNPAVTMDSAILTGNGCLAFATNIVNSTTQWTAPASWTELSEVAYNTPTNSGQTCFRVL